MAKRKVSGTVAKVMHEFKAGTLNSGSHNGPKVKSRSQAIAIALSEAAKKSPAKKVSAKKTVSKKK